MPLKRRPVRSCDAACGGEGKRAAAATVGSATWRQIVHDATGSTDTLVYDRPRLGAGGRFAGPAIVMQLDAITAVAAGWQAEIVAIGAVMLHRA